MSNNYWTTMGSKPKGFHQVPKKPQVYTYNIIVNCEGKQIDTIPIETKMVWNKERERKIVDLDYLKNFMFDKYNISEYRCNESMFLRDMDTFPIVSSITVHDKEKYLYAKKKKDRFNKINELLEDESEN